jgi:hypothetical protein
MESTMQPLTHDAQAKLNSIAQRYGVSTDAASSMLESLLRGNGSMAQFNHPELGGYGQWMRGGMTMVGDMFNNNLKSLVDGLANDLCGLLESNPFLPVQDNVRSTEQQPYGSQSQSQGHGALAWAPISGWWPAELGQPSTSGSQNDMRYAYFPGPRRLAIEQNGSVTVYDTLNHQIGGVSQQQGNSYSLSFTSQLGGVDLGQLPVVSGNARESSSTHQSSQTHTQQGSQGGYEAQGASSHAQQQPSTSQGHGSSQHEHDIFAKIERLAALKQKGVLTDDEFNAKKAELLARI